MTTSFDIRRATPEDAFLLATQRVAMFRDMGRTGPELEEHLLESCAGYLAKALASGEYVGWVAQLTASPHSAIGGAGVQFRPLLPRPDLTGQFLLHGLEGLILNVYVDRAHRRQGVARRLMDTLIRWAPGAGIARLVLHASPDGRRLYESLGFLASNEMFFPPFGTPGASRADAGSPPLRVADETSATAGFAKPWGAAAAERVSVGRSAELYLAGQLTFEEFQSAAPESPLDENVAELIDLIEHEPKQGGIFGVHAAEHDRYVARIREIVRALIGRRSAG